MHPLPKRLSDAVWATEWPLKPSFGEGNPPPQEAFPSSMGWAWNAAHSVRSAIDETGSPVPLDLAHRFLDELEGWTMRHRAALSWPATPLAFGRALTLSARQGDPTVVSVLVAYPNYCQEMLRLAHAADASVPLIDQLFFPDQANPAPLSNETSPLAADSVQKDSLASPSRQTRPPARDVEQDAAPPQFLVSWAKEVLEQKEPALAKQYLDTEIKKKITSLESGKAWQWFSRTVFPGMARMDPEQLQALVNAWPPHNRFAPRNPVRLVDSAPFWVVMRDAGKERREILCNGGLASIMDFSGLTPETRLEMATKMFPFVARQPNAFLQRLQLWMSLGGDLDAHADPSQIEGVDATTVREWIVQQDNEGWNAILESLSPSPQGSRFLRRRPGA